MSEENTQENFCETVNEMEEYDEFDYMLLFRALDSVRVTSKEVLEKEKKGKLSDTYKKNAYVKCKRQYSFYTCKIKPEIQQNKERQRLMTTLFSVIVFLATSYYTYWLFKQLWKGLSGQIHKVPIFWSCIYIILFNPLFSLVSVSINVIKFRSKSYMDKNKKDTIETVESKIQFALSCYDNFTTDNICAYYKYFDDANTPNKESLCSSLDCTECEDRIENSPLNKDVIASKIEKLNNVHQFFTNQKKFILKVHNPMIEIKHNVYVDQAIEFLLGKNVKTLITENIENSDETLIFLTNVSDIRANVGKIVQISEGFRYDEIGKINNYKDYFEIELSNQLNDIVLEIMKFYKSYFNINEYWKKNEFISDKYATLDNLVLYVDNYNPTTQTYETLTEKSARFSIDEGDPEKILKLFLEIITKLRRLNIAWLPEYIFLKNILFDVSDPTIDENTQRAFYKAKTIDELKPSFKRILALFVNNETFFSLSPEEEPLKMIKGQFENIENTNEELIAIQTDTDPLTRSEIAQYINYPINGVLHQRQESGDLDQGPEEEIEETIIARHLRNVFKLNIDSITGEKYVWYKNMPTNDYNGDSLIFRKCETFIYSLKNKSLPLDFVQKYKVECMLIKNVLIEYLDNVNIPVNKVVNYVDTFIDKHNPIPGDSTKILIFKGNVKKLFDFSMKKKAQEQYNADIYKESSNAIEFPNNYITFEEFNVKLSNIEKGQFLKYSEHISQISKDITYFIDKIEELNNKMERKQAMSKFYLQYAYIYIIASFFYLLSMCYETYFDDRIDFSFLQKKIDNEEKKDGTPANGTPANATKPTNANATNTTNANATNTTKENTSSGGSDDSTNKNNKDNEVASRKELEEELIDTEQKYEKLVKLALYTSIWMLSCVLIFTYNNKGATIVEYNRIMSNINTKKLEQQMMTLNDKISEYSEKQFPSASMDESMENRGELQSGISKTKKDVFIELIKAVELYDKCNYIQQNAQKSPFPWTEIMISGIILLIMITLIVVSNFQNNPFKKLNIEEDKVSLLKLVEETMRIPPPTSKGGAGIIDTSVDNELQKQLEKLNGLETMLATRISFFKADSTFNYVSVSFCIFVFSLYIGYNMLISNINFKNNLYSGNLYIRSKCYE
jgi:hypothetical protein